MGGIVFQELFQFAEAEPRVVGQERVERELEKAVQGASPALMAAMPVGANTTCFFRVWLQIYFSKGGFTRTGFACEENRVTGKLYEFQCALELRVLKVYFNVFFQIFGAMMSRCRV